MTLNFLNVTILRLNEVFCLESNFFIIFPPPDKERKFTVSRKNKYTVVGNNINIMKTTLELKFDFYQAFKQHGYTKIWKERKTVNLKSFTLITCKLVIRKKHVNN